MVVEIFKLRLRPEGPVVDPRHPVATITIQDGRGVIKIFDKSREELIRELFEEGAMEFVAGGRGADAAISYPAWSPEAVQATLKRLPSFSLGGRIA